MNPTNAIDVLNRLLAVLYRSLPVYLQGARPWVGDEQRRGLDALARIAADQRLYAQRVAEAVFQQGGRIETGQFPLDFTSVHDLSLEFLLRKAADYQRRDLEIIQECVAALSDMPRLRTLAEEILGNAQGHLETLEETMKEER